MLGLTVADGQRKCPGAVVLGYESPRLARLLEMGVSGSLNTVVGVGLEGGGNRSMWSVLVLERVVERIKIFGCSMERFAMSILRGPC